MPIFRFKSRTVQDPAAQLNFDQLGGVIVTTVPTSARPIISWGAINADGTIAAGSPDFSCARTAAGQYTVSWSAAKKGGAYAVDVSTDNQAGLNSMSANWRNRVAASFGVTTYIEGPLTASDTQWCFVVFDAQ